MSYRNPFKNKIQKIIDNWLDIFQFESKLSEEQMECTQFGICDYALKKSKEIPYFHF